MVSDVYVLMLGDTHNVSITAPPPPISSSSLSNPSIFLQSKDGLGPKSPAIWVAAFCAPHAHRGAEHGRAPHLPEISGLGRLNDWWELRGGAVFGK